MRNDRRGFSLVELLVVAVLGSLLVMATYQVLLTNQETYRENAENVNAQQQARTVLDFLSSELRELSAADIETIGGTSLRTWVMQNFGVVCSITYGPPVVLDVAVMGDHIGASDRVVVFADNDENRTADDDWIVATVTATDTVNGTCGSGTNQLLSFTANAPLFLVDSVRTGAPLRAQQRYRYVFEGSSLRRRIPPSAAEEVEIASGLADVGFTYYDSDGNTTSTPSAVHRIEISVVTADSTTLSSSIYLRN